MTYTDQVVDMQAVLYAQRGIAGTWTPPQGAPQPITALPAPPAATADKGGLWKERPDATPARRVRIRTVELTAAGLMTTDPATRAPAPAYVGALVDFDGVARRIIGKPEPADDLYRLEWVFDLD